MMNTPAEPESVSPEIPVAATAAQAPVSMGAPLEPREIWKPRDLLLLLAFVPFALVASKLGLMLAYAALRPFVGWRAKVDAVQFDTIFLLAEQCLFYVLILGFLFLLARLQHQQTFWASLGWKKPTTRQVIGYLVGGAELAIAVSLVLMLRPDAHDFPLDKLYSSRAASFAIGAFAISIAPLVEELVFRGLLFAVFERAAGWRFAVGATAVLFAGLHVPEYWPAWNHMLIILVVGLVFSLARGATGNLAISALLHIGYNSLIMTGLFFSTQQFRVPGGFGAN